MRKPTALLLALALLFCLFACQSPEPSGESYVAPPFLDAAFHADAATDENGALFDLSCTADGYVGVSATAQTRLKFQVCKDQAVYNYDLPADGTPAVFPLQCGNGSYRFRVMENVSEDRYAERCAVEVDVAMRDEFQPFLRPSAYVNYRSDSLCVQKAGAFAAAAKSPLDVVKAVYGYITDNVTYDAAKAGSVRAGYLPDVDETFRTGKGICFDYAVLAAAMLRSQGIPTKVVFGYVAPNGLYHAWNMFYTAETGWVTVSYEARGDDWTRLDLTFTANGEDAEFVGDGTHYTDVYFY